MTQTITIDAAGAHLSEALLAEAIKRFMRHEAVSGFEIVGLERHFDEEARILTRLNDQSPLEDRVKLLEDLHPKYPNG